MSLEEKVKKILVGVLGLDEEEDIVTPEADLFDDLAAESIDIVDICFRLEKDFQLDKVNPKDLFPAFLRKTEITDGNGNIKSEIIDMLSKDYPHTKGKLLDEFVETKDPNTFTKVKNIIAFVEFKTNNK